jgi:DNA-3-methyladenine glycosylase II
MRLSMSVKQPFSFAQTVAFLRSFPPCRDDLIITDRSITAAVSVRGIARAFTIHDGDPPTVEMARHVDAATQRALLARAAHVIGADDDVSPLYAAAEGDPPFRAVVRELHGLHHVRFLTLEDIAVYCVLMQRTPIARATLYRRRFLERFGIPVDAGGVTLRAMPELDQLVELDEAEIAAAIGHAPKARLIAGVVRGIAAIGEHTLRTAPYAAARDALLAIHGIGPFSAAAILLRGLGRMDELPAIRPIEDEARALYGAAYDASAIARRYGDQIGYWSFYLRVSAGRARRAAMARRSGPGARAAARAA